MLTPTGHAQHWTPALVEAAILAFVALHQRTPRSHEWCAALALPSHQTVARLCGDLATVYARLAITRTGRDVWTSARILDAIRQFQARTGRWPETEDFAREADLPHRVTVHRAFGTLANARRLAGMRGGGHEGHGGSDRGGGVGHAKGRR